ncbi:glycosyl hydrolase [Paenibacillus antarcticus]|nr:glycosyl hydrolase [Paenibacillus antarcticus]
MKTLKCVPLSAAAVLFVSLLSASGFSYAESLDTVSQKETSAIHWAGTSIEKWMGEGLIKGYPDGSFSPDKSVTRAEFVTIMNRVFGYYQKTIQPFADVSANAWYTNELSVAKEAGYYDGFNNNRSQADAELTRQDAVTLIARAFLLKHEGNIDASVGFKDVKEINAYAIDAVRELSNYVSGYSDGTFRPDVPITRAEVVTLVDKLVKAYYSQPGIVQGGSIQGNAVINHEGVTLKDANISGDLYLAPGIGEGEVTLDNVTVNGTTYVLGGGNHSIIIHNSNLNQVVVNRKEGAVTIRVTGSTQMERLVLNSRSTLDMRSGSVIGFVQANNPFELKGEKGSTVKKMEIGASANGSEVNSQGTLTEVNILSGSVKINGQLTNPGITSVINGRISSRTNMGPVTGSVSSGNTQGSSGSSGGNGETGGTDNGAGLRVENLVDAEATSTTKSLFAYLSDTRGKEVLFGQQHVTDVGLSFSESTPTGTQSDVKNAVGDFPAVYGWDTLSLEGKEKPGVFGDPVKSRENLAILMKKAHDNKGIITLSAHMPNFVTGGSFNDVKGNVVEHILPGGDKNADFNAYLDQVADLANQLKDDQGEAIPILFRPFHEQNGGWFWWGAQTTSQSEYVEIYRYTVEYLRDLKNVHNLLYVYSPNGSFGGSEAKYLTTYPGDDFVDILGMDQYDNQETPGAANFLNGLVSDLGMIAKLADTKEKVATFSEFGYSPSGMKTTGNGDLNWFTNVLNAIKQDPDAKRIAYMLTWANFNLNGNLFVPYHNASNLGDHELLPDFIKFYNDPYTAFNKEVGDLKAKKVQASAEKAFMHIASPVNQSTVRIGETKIRARVLDVIPSRVIYQLEGSDIEMPMVLDQDGYYSADWAIDPAFNGNTATFTVKAYDNNNVSILQQTNMVFVKVKEVLMKSYTFDNDTEEVESVGTWSGANENGTSIVLDVEHGEFDSNGALQLNATGLEPDDTWQELKLNLSNVAETVKISDVKRVKLDLLIPVSVDNNPDATVRTMVLLPPDYNIKFGMDSTEKKLTSLNKVTDTMGLEYYRYSASVDLTDPALSSAAKGLSISIVGNGFSFDRPIYVDNIQLFSVYEEAVSDPARIDDFEGYNGVDAAVADLYKPQGDGVEVSLDTTNKQGGSYGLSYKYTLGNQTYAGISKTLNEVDWSEFNQLETWIKADGLGQKLVFQLHVSEGDFEYYPDTSTDVARLEKMDFNKFVPVHGATGTLTKEKLKDVQKFSIFVNSVNGYTGTNSMYFDDIKAVYDPNVGDGSNGGGGSGSNPQGPGILYDFETGTEAWSVDESQNDANAQVTEVSSDMFSTGSKALRSAFSLTGTSFELKNDTPLDLKGLKEITAKVKLSSGSAKVKLYIKTGSVWEWNASEVFEIIATNGGDFTKITLPLDKVKNLDTVKSMGIKLESLSGTGDAFIYLDEITLVGVDK